MAEDTTAYIEMLEQEIKERVLEEERNTRSMMLTVIFLTIIVASVIVDKIAIAKRKAEIKNKWLKRDIEKLEKEKEKYMAISGALDARKARAHSVHVQRPHGSRRRGQFGLHD